jgi:hypothetical protein
VPHVREDEGIGVPRVGEEPYFFNNGRDSAFVCTLRAPSIPLPPRAVFFSFKKMLGSAAPSVNNCALLHVHTEQRNFLLSRCFCCCCFYYHLRNDVHHFLLCFGFHKVFNKHQKERKGKHTSTKADEHTNPLTQHLIGGKLPKGN